jgi:hypothetical protein
LAKNSTMFDRSIGITGGRAVTATAVAAGKIAPLEGSVNRKPSAGRCGKWAR